MLFHDAGLYHETPRRVGRRIEWAPVGTDRLDPVVVFPAMGGAPTIHRTHGETRTDCRLRSVDAINTFRVSAGHFASFRVLSRRQNAHFRRSAPFMQRVRFPAAPLRRARSGPVLLAQAWPFGHILGTPRNEVVHRVGHVIELIGDQMPVLIERHGGRLVA